MRGWMAIACVAFACSGRDEAPRQGAPAGTVSVEPAPVAPISFERGVERTEARRARGEYLVNGVIFCELCHSERDPSQPGHPPLAGRELAGRVLEDAEGRRVVAPNLTSDPKTGAARWSDAQLARAIRQRIGPDGRSLSSMPVSLAYLSDEDLASIIVYLRSLPALASDLPPPLPAPVPDPAAAVTPLVSVPSPDLGDPIRRGGYLISVADCVGCHTSWYGPRMPGVFAGGNPVAPPTFSSNLTVHPSGIGYGADTFVQVMKTGKTGTLHQDMPWVVFRNMTDEDLRAIYASLATLRPVEHVVINSVAPTPCPVCGQAHGGGDRNAVPQAPPGVEVAAATLDAYAGTYRHRDPDVEVVLVRDGSRLRGKVEQFQFELIPVSDTRFLSYGFFGDVRFERVNGSWRLIETDVIDFVLDRSAP